jgi:hypothetical protein
MYFEQLELLEYYLFSPQFSTNLLDGDIIIVKSQEALRAAFKDSRTIEGTKATPEHIAEVQEKIDNAMRERATQRGARSGQLEKEKANFAREFKIRLKDAQFIQIWTHAAEANDEQFGHFLNGRMTEDSFWGMDGLYGGLVKKFRMDLRRQYEKLLFNARGDKNAHVDMLWDEACRVTEAKMLTNAQNMKIFKNYLNGEYFKETPFDGKQSVLIGPRGLLDDDAALREYVRANKVITEFASMRMMMSGEKYNLDTRFLPVKDGVNLEQPGIKTQFKEKQKIVKLIHTYGGWMKTWGGVMHGDATERLQMRERSNHVRIAIPEVTQWADERAKDYWHDIQGFRDLPPEDQRRVYGELKSVFEYSSDKLDMLPDWESFVPDARQTKVDKITDWFKYNMNFNKLQKECRFDCGMQISDMHGLFPYLGVSESGARRSAQIEALILMLGGPNETRAVELAKQNFLTFVQLDAGLGYFMKKSTADTEHNRTSFLEKMTTITKYRPQANLLTLREGQSKSLRQWIKGHEPEMREGLKKYAGYTAEPVEKVEGRELFGSYYEYLDTIHEELFSQLALTEQIDYSLGLELLKEPPKGEMTEEEFRMRKSVVKGQLEIARKFFTDRHKGNEAEADKEMEHYFGEMKKAVDYLGLPKIEVKEDGTKEVTFSKDAAITELKNIRYGPLLMKMRWDDYPYELLQYPERALQIVIRSEGHPLYGKYGKNYMFLQEQYDAVKKISEKAEAEYMLAVAQEDPENLLAIKKRILETCQQDENETGTALHQFLQNTFDALSKDQNLATQYLMKASDKNEPQRAHDEQSGLWRRMWRDLGGAAELFSILGESYSVDPQESAKAMKKIHHGMVGMFGDDAAQINFLMTLTQKLAIQEVYASYGSMLIGFPNSAPIKTRLPGEKALSVDEVSHLFEKALALGSGKSRYQAPGASGFEYAAKDKLRFAHWNKWLGGMSKREEWMEKINKRFPWTKRFINAKTIEDLPEWLDLHMPTGKWKAKLLPVGLGILLLLAVYTIQQSSGDEKKHH